MILASRGLDYADLSKATGLKYSTLRNLACGNNRTRKGRAKVEAALGVAIWTEVAAGEGQCSPAATPKPAPCSHPESPRQRAEPVPGAGNMTTVMRHEAEQQ